MKKSIYIIINLLAHWQFRWVQKEKRCYWCIIKLTTLTKTWELANFSMQTQLLFILLLFFALHLYPNRAGYMLSTCFAWEKQSWYSVLQNMFNYNCYNCKGYDVLCTAPDLCDEGLKQHQTRNKMHSQTISFNYLWKTSEEIFTGGKKKRHQTVLHLLFTPCMNRKVGSSLKKNKPAKSKIRLRRCKKAGGSLRLFWWCWTDHVNH